MLYKFACFGKYWIRCQCVGSGCGTVGRAVASDARDPRFESSHRQFNLLPFDCFINCIENMKMKKKEAGNSPFSTTANLQSIGTS